MNYPLTLEQVSLRLQKGRGCIYLDNKEHAILEHCVSLDGNKVIKDSLDVMLLVDVEYFEEAKAHRDNVKEQVDDQEIVRVSLLASIFVFLFTFYSLIADLTPKLKTFLSHAQQDLVLQVTSRKSRHYRFIPATAPSPALSTRNGRYWRTHRRLLKFQSVPGAATLVAQVTVLWPHLSTISAKPLLLNVSPSPMTLMAFVCDP